MSKLAGMLKKATSQLQYNNAMAWGPQIDPESRPGLGESLGGSLGGQAMYMAMPGNIMMPFAGAMSSWLTRTGKIPFTNIKLFSGEADRQAADARSQGYYAGWNSPFVAQFAKGRR